MRRGTLHLTVGEIRLTVMPDGRVLADIPPQGTPFGVALHATVLYPDLRAFLAGMRALRERAARCGDCTNT